MMAHVWHWVLCHTHGQVQFAAHGQFCEDIAVEKKRAIHDANEQIDVSYEDLGSDGAVTVVTVVPGLPEFSLA